MKLTVQVTENDLLMGERAMSGSCPIAIALRRKTGLSEWRVSSTALYFLGETLVLPVEALKFVAAFDSGGSAAKPFEFVLEVPDWIYKHECRTIKENH